MKIESGKLKVVDGGKHTPGPWFAYDTTVCTIKPEKTTNGWGEIEKMKKDGE